MFMFRTYKHFTVGLHFIVVDFGLPDGIAHMVAFAGTEFINTLKSPPVTKDIDGASVFQKYTVL